MRKMTYLAVFEPVGNGAYSIYFPILRNKWIIGEPEQIVPYHII